MTKRATMVRKWRFYVIVLGALLQASTVALGIASDWNISVGPSYDYVVTDGGGGGYEAFPDITRLQDGRLMTVFYEGYGHVSLPNVDYPNGGRIMYVTSSDEGATWGPASLVCDTAMDDRDPSVTQLPDGRLFVVFFTYDGLVLGTYCVQSDNAGVTWSAPQLLAPRTIRGQFPHTPTIQRPADRRVILLHRPTVRRSDTERRRRLHLEFADPYSQPHGLNS